MKNSFLILVLGLVLGLTSCEGLIPLCCAPEPPERHISIKYLNNEGKNLFDRRLTGGIDTSAIKIYYETLDRAYIQYDRSGQFIITGFPSTERHLQMVVYEYTNQPQSNSGIFTSYIKLSHYDRDTLVAYVTFEIDSIKYNGKVIEPWNVGGLNLVTIVKE